ncbi:MAG: DUF2156 domain-containing protein [Oscillospiraceae bacterium]|nr:DUF2156 domain-containing protein [Oscillospiraceae bacterium]
MTVYNTLTPDDCSIIKGFFTDSGKEDCDHCFAAMLRWSFRHPLEWRVLDDTLFLRTVTGDEIWHLMPMGKMDPKSMLEVLKSESKEERKPFLIYGIDREDRQMLEGCLGDALLIEEDRDSEDYIYLTSDLSELPGKRYQKKRNHCARFEKDFPDYAFEELDRKNIPDARAFELEWNSIYSSPDNIDLNSERDGILRLLDNFEKLRLFGGLIRAGGRVLAITIAEELSSDMVDIVVEKAYHDVDSAYAVINRDFARNCLSGYRFINREDDVGDEGLRTAKLRYHPTQLKKKYVATAR